jgi:hypothetical protein
MQSQFNSVEENSIASRHGVLMIQRKYRSTTVKQMNFALKFTGPICHSTSDGGNMFASIHLRLGWLGGALSQNMTQRGIFQNAGKGAAHAY